MNTKQVAKLPKFLQPKKLGANLVRVGQNYDGGYLVDERNFGNTDILVGLGINEDWSFEDNFYLRKKVKIYAVDGTVSKDLFFKKLFRSIMRLHSPKKIIRRINIYRNYLKFFTGDIKHIEKLIGKDEGSDFISLKTLMKEINYDKNKTYFFKIDIENWEYQIFNDLISYSESIEGLVIELHNVQDNLSKIKHFVENFGLNLCHVHCNNYAKIGEDGIPETIECSFTKQSVEEDYEESFPHKLDMPNKKSREDYVIVFN